MTFISRDIAENRQAHWADSAVFGSYSNADQRVAFLDEEVSLRALIDEMQRIYGS